VFNIVQTTKPKDKTSYTNFTLTTQDKETTSKNFAPKQPNITTDKINEVPDKRVIVIG
jgi:hypothetical protein